MTPTAAARLALALGAAIVALAGCAAGPAASAGTPPHRSAWSSSTASPTPPTTSTTALVKFTSSTGDFTAVRPESWTSYPNRLQRPEEPAIGYLSNDKLTIFCQHTTSAACWATYPLLELSSHGVLITWTKTGSPLHSAISEFPGTPLSLDGSAARLDQPKPSTGTCRKVGGTVQILGTVQIPHEGRNFLQMTACFGPEAGQPAEGKAAAMFRSVEFVG